MKKQPALCFPKVQAAFCKRQAYNALSLNYIRSMMMKTVLCLSVVLMLAACSGKSETAAEVQPPKQEANSPALYGR